MTVSIDSGVEPHQAVHPLPVIAHPLGTAYLDGLLALSASAGWNQDADDWRHLLATGVGLGLSLPDGTVVACTVVLPYGPFAWISMVLVRPEHRRRGFASRLLRDALAGLEAASGRGAARIAPVLDATPAGHPVYRAEGFVDTWTFARHERAAAPAGAPCAAPPRGLRVEPLGPAHWPGLLALDARAFGASREPLLRALATRRPALAQVAVRADGSVAGHVLGRGGRNATQLGPLVAEDDATAIALLDAALAAEGGPLFVDAPDAQLAVGAALRARGFTLQRPFTRLVHPGPDPAAGPAGAPGEAALVRLVAGPELG